MGYTEFCCLVERNNVCIQWNLRKRTPPITETSPMQTRVCGPELFPLYYSCYKETSVLRTPPNKDTFARSHDVLISEVPL